MMNLDLNYIDNSKLSCNAHPAKYRSSISISDYCFIFRLFDKIRLKISDYKYLLASMEIFVFGKKTFYLYIKIYRFYLINLTL